MNPPPSTSKLVHAFGSLYLLEAKDNTLQFC